jgi:hypothetical protein
MEAKLSVTASREDPMALSRFLALIEETVMPTPNSVELHRSPRNDYLLRFDSRYPHIAELFQENTKLSPCSPLATLAPEQELKETKEWYFSTAYRIEDKDVAEGHDAKVRRSHKALPAPLNRLFPLFGKDGPLISLVYSSDLFVTLDNTLYRVVPGADYLWVEKRMSPEDLEMISGSIIRPEGVDVRKARALMFVAGAAWRYMLFLGPRGYRHMMFEAGNLIGQLCGLSGQLGLTPTVCLDFYDEKLDRVLRLDGAERSTLAIIALEGGVS